MSVWKYTYQDELYHHGVKGMKWGVKRFQNKDGTRTLFGKKRRSIESMHDDYKKAHDKKSIKSMSDSELRARNNRLQMEHQYKQLTKKKSIGKKAVQTFIGVAGAITAVQGAHKAYKEIGNKALDAIGDWILKDINLKF